MLLQLALISRSAYLEFKYFTEVPDFIKYI